MGQLSRLDFSKTVLSNFYTNPSPPLTSLQRQTDGLVSSFMTQAFDGRALCALTAGGLAYRAGRVGVMGLGVGQALRVVSVGSGLVSEVAAFEFTQRVLSPENRDLWKWSGQGGLRQGLFQSFVTFGALKGAGRLASGENFIAQHLFQDSAMVLSHRVTGALGLTAPPAGSLAEQFLHAEALNLQVGAGAAFVHHAVPSLHPLERALDLFLNRPETASPTQMPFQEGPLPALAGPLNFPAEKKVGFPPEIPRPPLLLSENHSEKGGEGRAEAREALETLMGDDLRDSFPEIFVEDALHTALDLPQRLEGSSLEFLKGLLALSSENPMEAHLTLLAAREILIRDPLSTVRSGYPEALAQLFLESAVQDPDSGRRGFAFRAFHEATRRGFTSVGIEDLLVRFGYGSAHQVKGQELEILKSVLWKQAQTKEVPFHDPGDVALALEALSDAAFPHVGLRRMDRVFTRNAHPSKLVELAYISPNRIISLEKVLLAEDPVKLARKINGSVHTAFVKDLSLAEKIIEVLAVASVYRFQARPVAAENRRRIIEEADRFFQSGEALSVETLVHFVEMAGKDRFSFPSDGSQVLILPDSAFNRAANDIFSKPVALGFSDPFASGGPTIYLRELLPKEEPYDFWDSFLQLTARISALVRESERLTHPYPYDAHGSLVSEMKARLEEYLWRLCAGLDKDWQLADRLGGMVRYLRHRAEDSPTVEDHLTPRRAVDR